jgi:uncharacterized protein (TIGR00369 family)
VTAGSSFQPRNPAFEVVVREALLAMPFARLLGVDVGSLTPGQAELQMAARADLQQGDGFFQAGVIGALADLAGGAASATLLEPGWALVTADYTVKIVSPGTGDHLIGRGQVVQSGSSLSVARAEVFSSREGRERLCAVALVTTRPFERRRRGS